MWKSEFMFKPFHLGKEDPQREQMFFKISDPGMTITGEKLL